MSKVLVVRGQYFFKDDPLMSEVIEHLKSLGYETKEYVYDDHIPEVAADKLIDLTNADTDIEIIIGSRIDASIVECPYTPIELKKILINTSYRIADKIPNKSLTANYEFIDHMNNEAWSDMPVMKFCQEVFNIFDDDKSKDYIEHKEYHSFATFTKDDYKEALNKFIKKGES